MRRGNGATHVSLNGKKVAAFHLPTDFCAEHEWGIRDLHDSFGVKKYEKHEGPCGVERRLPTVVPDVRFNLGKIKGQDAAALTVGFNGWEHEISLFDKLHPEISDLGVDYKTNKQKTITSAWSERDFGLMGVGKNIEYITDLYEQIKALNVILYLGGQQFPAFDNGYLNIVVADRLTKEQKQQIYDADANMVSLYQTSESIGIVNRVKENLKSSYGGCPFYALSPRWTTEIRGEPETKHKVMYWLNPADQQDNNYGYFTVEQLEQWIEGKGT